MKHILTISFGFMKYDFHLKKERKKEIYSYFLASKGVKHKKNINHKCYRN